MNNGPDIFVYKMVADNGGAPCVDRNLLSLAICKGKIRKSAQPSALLFGFGGKTYGERLIYIARVTSKLSGSDYYRLPEFKGRPDRIYREREGKAEIEPRARYHQDGSSLRKDVGPLFEHANVLLSDDFCYFGAAGNDTYKTRYPALRQLIESLKQGHRRKHDSKVRDELLRLKDEIWASHDRRKIGLPSDADRSKVCNRDAPCRIC